MKQLEYPLWVIVAIEILVTDKKTNNTQNKIKQIRQIIREITHTNSLIVMVLWFVNLGYKCCRNSIETISGASY